MRHVAAAIMTAMATCCTAAAQWPIEGDWQVTGGGPELRISAVPGSDRLSIIWLDGDDLSVPEGREVGYAMPAITDGVYDCFAYSDIRGDKGRESGHIHFVARMKDADSFVIEAYDRKIVFNLRMLLPLWYRRAINVVDERPQGLDGARRIGARPQNNGI